MLQSILAALLSFLDLAAKECWHVQIVGGGLLMVNYFGDYARNILNCGSWRGLGFRAGRSFPSFGHERGLLDRPAIDFAEAGGDDRYFDGLFHVFVHYGAENDVGIFMGGFLDD